MALFTSCGVDVPPPDDSRLEEKFPLPSVTDRDDFNNLDIYVDGSQSMRGYVSSERSVYCNVIGQLVEFATISQFSLNIYKFDSRITQVTHLPMAQLLSAQFYDGADTPLATILDRIADSPSHSAIIVTDLVQSQRGTDALVLAKSLEHLSHQTRELRLLAYRSNFQGSYYPERVSMHSIQVEASQSLPGRGRPFYLLVVAPNAKSMRRVEAYLLSRVPPVEMINPTGPAVSIEDVSLGGVNAQNAAWKLYKPLARKEVAMVRRITSAFRLARPAGAQDVLPLNFNIRANMPIRDPEQLNWEITRATWKGGGNFGQPTQVNVPIHGGFGKSREKLEMQFVLHEPDLHTWDIYFIKMHAGEGNLDVPAWINDWTTNDDSVAANGNKTFQLAMIVQSMINAIAERSVFCEYVLEVGR